MQIFPLITSLFISVNLDFFIVLLFLLKKYSLKSNVIGYELGMLIVFFISALAGQLIQTLIPAWAIGFLGLIPIFMGIKSESDENEEDNVKSSNKSSFLAVMLVYLISCGADNIAVYVPVLSTLSLTSIGLTAVYFVILSGISVWIAYSISNLPPIVKIFERWGARLSRIIYILIGLFVIFDTDLIQKIMSLFS